MHGPDCISVHHVYAGASGDQKRVLDALELELPAIVSHHVNVANQIQVLCKSSKDFELLNHLSTMLNISNPHTNHRKICRLESVDRNK